MDESASWRPTYLYGHIHINSHSQFRYDVGEFRAGLDEDIAFDSLHTHDFPQLWYTQEGSYIHHYMGDQYPLSSGSLFIVPPYCTHSIDTRHSGAIRLLCCEFSTDFINKGLTSSQKDAWFNIIFLEPVLMSSLQIKPILCFQEQKAEIIESLFCELNLEYAKQDQFRFYLIRQKIIELLSLISQEYDAMTTKKQQSQYALYRTAIQTALDYIHKHYMEQLYLEDVCRHALVSVSLFTDIFKRITGLTFTEYVQYLRVLRARELLQNTDRILYDICMECGFNNPVHFRRVFRKYMGYSPSEYRKQL